MLLFTHELFIKESIIKQHWLSWNHFIYSKETIGDLKKNLRMWESERLREQLRID